MPQDICYKKVFLKEFIEYNGTKCPCKQKNEKLTKKRMILASKLPDANLLLKKEGLEEDITFPEYEYDEDIDNVSEEEYDNDVMEEEVIEREKGPELR